MKKLKDFLIGLFLVLWLLYPMTHLTCFDNNIWKFILWFNTSVIITVISFTLKNIKNTTK